MNMLIGLFVDQIFFDEQIIQYIATHKWLSEVPVQFIAIGVHVALFFTWVFFLRQFHRSRDRRRTALKDLSTLRILLDYMRVGQRHFAEMLARVVPEASEGDRELVADRVFNITA